MLGKEPFRIVIRTGVARFDAHGNLFVNLPHTEDSPQTARIGGPDGEAAPSPEKRARVHGAGGAGTTRGSLPATAELPRGMTLEVKGYESITAEGGAIVVELAAGATIPDWFRSGADHHFPGTDGVRLWAKSSIPDGLTLQGAQDASADPIQPKPQARAQFQPKSEKKEAPAATQAPPTPEQPEAQPYRPERLAAGHLGSKPESNSKGLGCSTLLVLVALTAGALVAFL